MDDEKDICKEVTLPHGWDDKQIDLGSVVQEKNGETARVTGLAYSPDVKTQWIVETSDGKKLRT